MPQEPRPSAERNYVVYDGTGGKYSITAMSPSVDDGGYLCFYRSEETGYVPVAGFPRGAWTAWKLDDSTSPV